MGVVVNNADDAYKLYKDYGYRMGFSNAPSHLGSLNSNAEFHALFYKCMYGCESEMEFERTWKKMITDHKLQDHSWLNSLHKCREKWSTAFSIDVFSSQIKSSQRAEVTNNVLQGLSTATTSLTKFFIEFEKLVARWHSSEGEKDFQCMHGSVTRAIKNCAILVHASEAYTHEIYKCFEKEFLDGIALTWKQVSSEGTICTFEVEVVGNDNSRIRKVYFDTSTLEISCSCKKFEGIGYLCSHALRILSVKNVLQIPDKYILKRWTKDAKKRVHKHNDIVSSEHNSETESTFRNRMLRFAYDLILKSQGNQKTRQHCEKILCEGDAEIEKLLSELNLDKTGNVDKDSHDHDHQDNMDNEQEVAANPIEVPKSKRKNKGANKESSSLPMPHNNHPYDVVIPIHGPANSGNYFGFMPTMYNSISLSDSSKSTTNGSKFRSGSNKSSINGYT
ncbi:Zinc finger, PMZ-type [Corchorus capsularis]|uniref:Protein FAR1-RELATED SEQUENCE n=1 Tax=Corchorus capsularis TaxID=210143 RepID=A0A1R3G8F6_COCAP|nr:Zinc finger, PMZ-type [Corchorus capsularis]